MDCGKLGRGASERTKEGEARVDGGGSGRGESVNGVECVERGRRVWVGGVERRTRPRLDQCSLKESHPSFLHLRIVASLFQYVSI